MCDWEFVWYRIGGGRCKENIIGEKAAPDGVVIEIELICGEERGGVVL